MKTQCRLLSRIDRRRKDSEVVDQPSLSDIEHCVLQHLRRLFQVRKGEVLSSPECGLPDFSHLFLKPNITISAICSIIKDTIEAFEPRLSNVRVGCLSQLGELELRFEIKAEIYLSDEKSPFRVQTVMSDASHLRLAAG